MSRITKTFTVFQFDTNTIEDIVDIKEDEYSNFTGFREGYLYHQERFYNRHLKRCKNTSKLFMS